MRIHHMTVLALLGVLAVWLPVRGVEVGCGPPQPVSRPKPPNIGQPGWKEDTAEGRFSTNPGITGQRPIG